MIIKISTVINVISSNSNSSSTSMSISIVFFIFAYVSLDKSLNCIIWPLVFFFVFLREE